MSRENARKMTVLFEIKEVMNEPLPLPGKLVSGDVSQGEEAGQDGTERQGYSARSLGPSRRGAGASASSCLWAPKIQPLLIFWNYWDIMGWRVLSFAGHEAAVLRGC